MLKLLPTLPVRTRVPLAVWAVAGMITVLSLASSLLHAATAPSKHAAPRAEQGHQTSETCQKVKIWAARG